MNTATSRPRRGRGLALGAMAIAAIAVPQALAHSALHATSPTNGATVKGLPALVRLTFDEPIGVVTSVRVLDAKNVNHAVAARRDPRNAARVVVRTRNPTAGAYRVLWKVVATDGHAESGVFRFRVTK